MTIKLESDRLAIQRVAATGSAQSFADAVLQLPEGLPDIEEVVELQPFMRLGPAELADGLVRIQGSIDVAAVYNALAPGGSLDQAEDRVMEDALYEGAYEDLLGDLDEAVPGQERAPYGCSWRDGLEFSLEVEVPEAPADGSARADVELESLDFEVSEDRRGLAIEVVLAGNAEVYQTVETELLTRVIRTAGEQLEVQQEEVASEQFVASGFAETGVQNILDIEEAGKPEIGRIVSLTAHPIVRQAKAEGGQVQVKGNIIYELVYVSKADEATGLEEVVSNSWEATGAIDLEIPVVEAADGMTVRPQVMVSNVELMSENSSSITVDLLLWVRVDAIKEVLYTLVESIGGPDAAPVRTRRESLSLREVIGREGRSLTLTNTLQVQQRPPVEEIILARAQASVLTAEPAEDAVLVTGDVTVKVAYVPIAGESDSMLVIADWPAALPFEARLDMPGVTEDAEVEVDLEVSEIESSLVTGDRIQVSVVLDVSVAATSFREQEVVTEGVVVAPRAGQRPALVFVVIQPGDTLWKMSQAYQTSIDDLIAANPWLQEVGDEQLPAGRKLCIPPPTPEERVS